MWTKFQHLNLTLLQVAVTVWISAEGRSRTEWVHRTIYTSQIVDNQSHSLSLFWNIYALVRLGKARFITVRCDNGIVRQCITTTNQNGAYCFFVEKQMKYAVWKLVPVWLAICMNGCLRKNKTEVFYSFGVFIIIIICYHLNKRAINSKYQSESEISVWI